MIEIRGYELKTITFSRRVLRSAESIFNEIEYEFAHGASVITFQTTPPIAEKVVVILDDEYQERLQEYFSELAEDEEPDVSEVYKYTVIIKNIEPSIVNVTVY